MEVICIFFGGGGGGGRGEVKFFENSKKKIWVGGRVGRGGQGGCERRSEVFVKIIKKTHFYGGIRSWGRVFFGGQGECKRRSEAFVRGRVGGGI